MPKYPVGSKARIVEKGYAYTGKTVTVEGYSYDMLTNQPAIHFTIDWGEPDGEVGFVLPESWFTYG